MDEMFQHRFRCLVMNWPGVFVVDDGDDVVWIDAEYVNDNHDVLRKCSL